MQELLERFRREAAGRGGLRYSEELKELARQYAQRSASLGGSRRQAAGELGVGEATLVGWLRAKDAGAADLCEVVVASGGRVRGSVAVISPSGWRVEGLLVSEAAELLAALA